MVRPALTQATQEETVADRETKERKLIALMVNDMEASLDRQALSRAGEEVRALPEDELDGMLASRLNLSDPADAEALDDALRHVQEPETPSGSPTDLPDAPDMSHNPGPGEHGDG